MLFYKLVESEGPDASLGSSAGPTARSAPDIQEDAVPVASSAARRVDVVQIDEV